MGSYFFLFFLSFKFTSPTFDPKKMFQRTLRSSVQITRRMREPLIQFRYGKSNQQQAAQRSSTQSSQSQNVDGKPEPAMKYRKGVEEHEMEIVMLGGAF